MNNYFWVGFEKRAEQAHIIERLRGLANDPNYFVVIQGEGGRYTNEDPEKFKEKLEELKGKEDFDWSVSGKETDFSSVYEKVRGEK